MKPGRNDPCPCGSGRKYKKCCLPRQGGAAGSSSARTSRLLRSSARASLESLPLGLQLGSSPFSTSKPLTMTTEIMQGILERMYGDWPDEPIPALDDRTPLQAMESPEGRHKVIRLLELYEEGEVQSAREQDREPASFDFLWQATGLERE